MKYTSTKILKKGLLAMEEKEVIKLENDFWLIHFPIMFFASFVIACSLNPLVDKFFPRLKRPVASGIILSGIILLILLIFIPLIIMAGNEIKSFAVSFPQYFANIEDFVDKIPFVNKSDIAKIDITNVVFIRFRFCV